MASLFYKFLFPVCQAQLVSGAFEELKRPFRKIAAFSRFTIRVEVDTVESNGLRQKRPFTIKFYGWVKSEIEIWCFEVFYAKE